MEETEPVVATQVETSETVIEAPKTDTPPEHEETNDETTLSELRREISECRARIDALESEKRQTPQTATVGDTAPKPGHFWFRKVGE
jgi:hypothetical protein